MSAIHVSLDVRAAIGWPKRLLRGMFKDAQGRVLSADETRERLLDHLQEGHRFLPLANCPGFSYQTGCPGHEE